MRRLALLVVAAVVLGGAPAHAWAPWEVWQGNRAYGRGDFDAAAERYLRAVEQAPDDAVARLDLGTALYRAGRYPAALSHLGQALESPDPAVKARAFYALGNLRFQQQDWAAAAEAYKGALRWNEEDDDARHNLQEALDRMRSGRSPSEPPPPGSPPPGAPRPTPSPPAGGASPRPSPPPPEGSPSPSPQPGGKPREDDGLTREDAERLLRYFDDRERKSRPELHVRPQVRPPRGSETW